MNAGLLIGISAVIVPIVVIEVRRKVDDWRRSRNPRAMPDTIWMGFDPASGDDLCSGHGVVSYTAVDHSASGTSCDISSGGDA
ncbi:hypothetical protein [Sphingomonas hankookensis]|uniref:hypothetical protein n=1 Tax=Sphingomonas hankookensis TaxID=563996 RepID=UPI003D302232